VEKPHQTNNYENKSLIDSGCFFSIFACYAGIILDNRLYNGTPRNINDTPVTKSLFRIVICLTMLFFIFLPYYTISYTSSILVLTLFKTFMPFFVLTFFMFAFAKPLFRKFNLVNMDKEDELMRATSEKEEET
jgi:hypothetical protein